MSGIVYGILWILVRSLSWLALRYRAVGTEHVPRTGGVLLAANHASYVDIPLLGCGVWRRLWYVGRANLFPHPVLNWALRGLGWIPLKPERADRKAFRHAVQLLSEDKAVVIFPEGTRTADGTLQAGKLGIGVIVSQARCPVVPVYIGGTFEVLPTGASWPKLYPVEVRFGEALDFQKDLDRFQGKEFYQYVSQTVMNRIAELGKVGPPADPRLSTTVTQPPVSSRPSPHHTNTRDST